MVNNAATGNPAITDPAETRRVGALADRRAIRARALSMAGRWLSSAAIVALALVFVWKFVPSPWLRALDWWWLIAAPMALAAVPAALALARPARSRRGTLTLDENLSLKDRLTSAIDLHDHPPPGVDAGFAELAVRHAEALARDVRADVAVPIRADRAWAVWPSIVVLAIGAGVLVRTRPPATVVVPPVSKEEVKQAGEQVRAAAKVIESMKGEPTLATPDVQRQLESIADVERELAAGRTLPADARTLSAKALERLAQSLKDNADRELATQDALRDSLLSAARATHADPTTPDAGGSDTSELAKALTRGDLPAAEEAARELVEQMPSMSPDERAALASELRDLATQMAKQDAASPGASAANRNNVENATNAEQDAARESDRPGEPPRENGEADKRDASNHAAPDKSDAKTDAAKPEESQSTAAKPNEDKPNEGTPDENKPDARQPAPTSAQTTPPGEHKPDAGKPDESAPPAPPSGTPNEKPESEPASAEQDKPQGKPADQEKPKASSAEQRKDQLRRAMEDAARDLSKSDKPRDTNQRKGDSDRPSGQSGEQSREPKPGDQQQQTTRDGKTPRQNQPKPGDQPGETKREQQGEKQVDKQGEQGLGNPEQDKSEQGKSDQGKPAPTSDDKAQGAEQKNQQQGDRQPSTAPGQSPRPDANGEKTPTPQKNGGESSDQRLEGTRPDPSKPSPGMPDEGKQETGKSETDKPDAAPNGEKSPRPDAPGLQRLADTLKEAQEAQENASRDSKLADRLREQAMKTLENASPEQIDKAAEAARELAKRRPKPDPNSVSPEVAKKMLEQAEQLMKNATPEQQQKLRELARKMAEGMPDNNNSNNNNNAGGERDENSQDAARQAAEEFVKHASPEDMKKLSELARSLGLDRSGGRGRGDQPGDGPGRERGTPRRFGDAETKTIDMRDRTSGQAPTPEDRVISDWFDPAGNAGARASSSRSASGAEVVRRAAQGAERSIEQQVVPSQQGEYVRRVFRRYLQRAQGAAATPGAPTSAPATPDAPDAPRK